MAQLGGGCAVTIDPDDFLETAQGRVWTVERNQWAWAQSYAALEKAIADRPGRARVILVCGIQGAGKSYWIAAQPACADMVYFSAALPGIRYRAPIVAIARRLGAWIEAVWIDTPLDLALARNERRTSDKVVPPASILAVARQFEAPSLAEGFDRVRIHKSEAA